MHLFSSAIAFHTVWWTVGLSRTGAALWVARQSSENRLAEFKGGDDGFRSVRRGDQRDPRLVDDGRPRADTRRAQADGRSAAWCSTTRCSRSGCPKPVYHALRRTITHGEALDPSVADAVAAAMKDWAVEHGATHYTHWFQPLTGITAEKHDSFLSPDRRRQGRRGVLGQGTDQGRARRLELPVGRHALHLRSARLHGVGSDEPAVAAVQRRRGHAGDPDGVRELDRRNARQEDAAAALDGSAVASRRSAS